MKWMVVLFCVVLVVDWVFCRKSYSAALRNEICTNLPREGVCRKSNTYAFHINTRRCVHIEPNLGPCGFFRNQTSCELFCQKAHLNNGPLHNHQPRTGGQRLKLN